MANLSLNLSSWMMVSTLLCLLLLLCFSVPAQVNKTVVHAAGTKDSSITRIVSKDSVLHEADSLLRTRVINQPQSLISSLKQTAQQAKKILHDTLPAGKQISGVKLKGYLGTVKMDTIRSVADTSIKRFSKSAQNALTSKVKKAKEGLSGLFDFLKKGRPDSLLKGAKLSALPLPPATPLVHFGGGYINYAYNCRSATDTPFAEKNIGQHNITGTTGVMLANILPVNINFWIRRSNSILFRDITDIQVSFDPAAFRNRLVDNLRRKMLAFLPSFNDSLLKSLENIKSNELSKTKSWLQTPFNVQRLREYRELLGIHALHPENMPTDSLARLKKELQLKEAAVFIKLYDSTRLQYDTLTRLTDSLK
ncbi:MAG TPA: hypothetical protein VK588_03665, partial [Chitinophagaceae bacterium]|nr:hypothetical protein [Chitinophagaceae bacterium]